jgi:hypothetical protein
MSLRYRRFKPERGMCGGRAQTFSGRDALLRVPLIASNEMNPPFVSAPPADFQLGNAIRLFTLPESLYLEPQLDALKGNFRKRLTLRGRICRGTLEVAGRSRGTSVEGKHLGAAL